MGTQRPRRRKRGGRPPDPTCGAPPDELVRHPFVLAEPDDARALAFAHLCRAGPIPRPIRRVVDLGELHAAVSADRAPPCVLADHDLARRCGALARLVRDRPTLPVFITSARPIWAINTWCNELLAHYLPGPLDPEDVERVQRSAEGYEGARVSHLAWVVRRGTGRLKTHEALLATRALEGLEGDALRGPYAPGSFRSIVSRTRKVLGVRSWHELIQDRLDEWSDYGTDARAPWAGGARSRSAAGPRRARSPRSYSTSSPSSPRTGP